MNERKKKKKEDASDEDCQPMKDSWDGMVSIHYRSFGINSSRFVRDITQKGA